jgi:hypothetical protein
MAYSKAELENHGDKTFPFFKPFFGTVRKIFASTDFAVFLLALVVL